MSEWINCKDRMPTPDDYVLVKIAYGGIHLAWYRDEEWLQDKEHCISSSFITSVIKSRITHWQPLPNPPEAS